VYVDGKRAEKLTVYEAQRGVVVEKGAHAVEWRYTAPGLVLGAGISLAGVLLVGLAQWWARRRAWMRR
jgi:uncharacterized membrane protein YfhO